VACLIAWNENGDIVATLDGLYEGPKAVDVEAREAAGVRLKTFWNVSGAVASGSWPEHLGVLAHDFRVEVGPDGRIAALVHRDTGVRRTRSAVTAALDDAQTRGVPVARLAGGPGLPGLLDLGAPEDV